MLTTVAGAEAPLSEADITRRAFRKAITRLVPVLVLAYIVSYIDRTNIGFAALSMNRDIGLTNTEFGWGAGILFFSYCAFELPSSWALYKVGARRWLARIMITWGILSALTALIAGPASFYGLRFMLGLAEAGFTPGAMLFFALWFPPQYRSRILSWFQMAVPLASLVSGPLSVGILHLDGTFGVAGWRWLFVLEGLPAVAIGIALALLLSDGPAKARWLAPEERDAVAKAVAAERRDRPVHGFWASLADWRVLVLAGIQFGFTIGSYGVAIWLPLILKAQNLSTTAVGWTAAIPYLCGCVATVIWSAHVDRTGKRASNLIVACLVGTAGLVISVLVHSFTGSFFGICLALVGVTSARGTFWSIPPRFLTGLGAAGGLAFINSIGTLGGFFGPVVMGWLKDTTGSFDLGLLVMAAFLAASAALALVLRLTLRQD